MIDCTLRVAVEYCSTVWYSATDTHIIYWPVLSVVLVFFTDGVLECYIDLWQYCVCYILKSCVIRCTLFMVLYLYKMWHAVVVTRGTLIAHRFTYAPPRCMSSQYLRTFSLLSISVERPCWKWRFLRAGPMLFYWLYRPFLINKSNSILFFLLNMVYEA